MKKSLLLAGMLAVGLANAQTGKVGINTENPNETLEVNGTVRVDNLPESGVGTIYDGADTAGTTFKGENMVVADEKGTLGKAYYPFPKFLVGGKGVDAFTTHEFDYEAIEGNRWTGTGNRSHEEEIGVYEFEVERTSVIDVNLQLGFSLQSYKGIVANGMSEDTKRVAAYVKLSGTEIDPVTKAETEIAESNILNPGVSVVRQIGQKSIENYKADNPEKFDADGNVKPEYEGYVTGSGAGGVTGVYSINGRDMIVLKPGKYKIRVTGRVTLGTYDTTAFRIRWGVSTFDRFDVLALPLEF